MIGPATTFAPARQFRDPDAQMLAELCLDLQQAATDIVGRGRGPGLDRTCQFLVVARDGARARLLRGLLDYVHREVRCELPVDPLSRRVQFWISGGDSQPLRGRAWYSWGVFCDPALTGLTPPYSLVRSIERLAEDVWAARDRSGADVLHLTDEGARALLERSTCPITCRRSVTVPSVTYPAWHGIDEIRLGMRLRRAFEL